MKRKMSRITVGFAITVAVLVVSQGTAHAALVARIEGVGDMDYSGGLSMTPTNQSVVLVIDGAGFVATQSGTSTGSATGLFRCVFVGNGVAETVVAGSGTMSGNCNGGGVGAAQMACSISYTRLGAFVVLTMNCAATAQTNPIVAPASGAGSGIGHCDLAPTQVPPATVHDLQGHCEFTVSGI